ncbi:subtilisin-like protease [Colletotrichum truncatum]|uniref:Subtilisin-like protease n=1 Tax=Colletotrichum truncatum TaxID=5467 RepID=A0ACC3Z509_COLTU|nr:subtilisin-like protease [Colletotrichum truncatum]KAF6795058.1 subtilisin-like protease [Colletotrichum truncatum]
MRTTIDDVDRLQDTTFRQALLDNSLQLVSASPEDVLYTYENTITGFAAQLTEEQARALRAQPEVLAVTHDQVYSLFTTRSSQFLGLASNAGNQRNRLFNSMPVDPQEKSQSDGAEAESNIIIGSFDSGAWPEHPSYNDNGMAPIPAHWKGICQEGEQWTTCNCNRKLIGARAFYKGNELGLGKYDNISKWADEYRSARDADSHGTHTSTIAAGSEVANASLFGLGLGTARGVAKDARLAIYKVCWNNGGCSGADTLAAIDQAIADGVNVVSFSIGISYDPDASPLELVDSLFIATFKAMKKGIFVSAAAGNDGPGLSTVTNVAPWVLTVAASTLDRDFAAHITLGNGRNYTGVSFYTNDSVSNKTMLYDGGDLPLIHANLAGKDGKLGPSNCTPDNLDPEKIIGKVVVCEYAFRPPPDDFLMASGARGMILVNKKLGGESLRGSLYDLPVVHLGFKDGLEVAKYAKESNATVVFDFEGTRFGIPAPQMAEFSSRGPNVLVPELLKPDITGPGVDILAGWPRKSPTALQADSRKVFFNIDSGTSMSCPQLSGVAAFMMARRPG